MHFRTEDVPPRVSGRLADLVASRSWALDVRALASRTVAEVPEHPCDTPYVGIRCMLHGDERAAAVTRPCSDANEAARVLRETLRAAVDRMLGSARRVAVLAGGGVDSGGLLALTVDWAKRTGGSAFAVALDFEAAGDDRPHMRALEAHLRCEVIRVNPRDSGHRLALLAGVDAAPLCWPTAAMEIEMMTRARENGAERVLTGGGGDQLLNGNPRALATLVGYRSLREALSTARSLRGFEQPRSPAVSWVVRPLLATVFPRSVRVARARLARIVVPAWAGPLLRAFIETQRDRRAESAEAATSAVAPSGVTDARERIALAWLRHANEVAAGIRRVDPYLDAEVIATVGSFPPSWLLHGGVRRGLFREAMRGWLPETTRLRDDKACFEPALEAMLAARKGKALDALTTGDHLAARGIVDRARFATAARSFLARPSADPTSWSTLWPALAVEAFLRAREGAWP